jgi:hypothetical protein
MGYIRDMYGSQNNDFIRGFLAALDTYSVYRNGKRWIGGPECEVKSVMKKAIIELGGDPKQFGFKEETK